MNYDPSSVIWHILITLTYTFIVIECNITAIYFLRVILPISNYFVLKHFLRVILPISNYIILKTFWKNVCSSVCACAKVIYTETGEDNRVLFFLFESCLLQNRQNFNPIARRMPKVQKQAKNEHNFYFRSKPRLEPHEILNEVLVKTGNRYL